jgi:cytosine/adenosine deaminase-related metal-dependent hydrolase
VSARILLRSGCVLTLGTKTHNFHEADVLLEDGVVAEIGRGLSTRGAEEVDAADTIVMPGFVDTHRHVWKSLFRNLGDAAAGVDAAHLEPDDVYAATLIGLLGAVEAGITTVVDWADVPDDQRHVEAALQAHLDAGLRTVFVHPGLQRRPQPPGPLTTVAFGSPDLSRSEADRAERQWAEARGQGLRIHAHAGLDTADAGVVAALGEKGLLGADVTLVHGSRLGDADLDAIAASGAAISLAPSSEMAGGLGAPPLQKFLDRNIRPGLAVDDERVAPGDLFAQMRIANSVQHAAYFDLKLAGKAGLPNLLNTRDIIRYATVVGARTAGLGEVAGSLEPGRQADVVVLRTDRPNVYPINDPIGAVVWGLDTSNVEWVFVAGRALMREGVLTADVAEARRLAVAAQGRAAGMLAETGAGEER